MNPATVTVTLRGLKRDLKLFNPLSLRVAVDLEEAEAGTYTVVISDGHLDIPGPLQMAQADPPSIEFELAQAKKSKPFRGLFGLGSSKDKKPDPDDDQPDAKPSE